MIATHTRAAPRTGALPPALSLVAQIRIAAAGTSDERIQRVRDRLLIPRNSTEARTLPLRRALLELLANGGELVVPHLVRGERPPAPAKRLPIAPRHLAAVRDGLWQVVNAQGTGAAAFAAGLDIAGKTGTVQVVAQETWIDSATLPWEQRDHAWFASYAPAGDPRLVVVVFVEHGGKGSRAAAPVAKALHEKAHESEHGIVQPS